MNSNCFSALEIDAIGEILNISLGASATAVSTMLNARVDITTPIVKVIRKDEFEMDKVDPAVGVEITYVSGLEGKNIMLLKRHDVKVIVEMLMGMEMSDEEFELNEMNISAICEVMNQMMGASSTALSEFLEKVVNISTPTSFEVDDDAEFLDMYFPKDEPKVVAEFTLKIADKLESEFYNLMPVSLAKELVKGFLPEDVIMEIEAEAGQEEAQAAPEPTASASSGGGTLSQEEIEKLLAGNAAEETPQAAPEPTAPASSGGGTLSQEEIEKLLAGGIEETPAAPTAQNTVPQPEVTMPQPGTAAQPQMTMPQPEAAVQPQMNMQQPQMGMPQMGAMQQPQAGGEIAMMQMQMMQQMMQQMQAMQHQLDEAKKQPPEPRLINVQTAPRPNLNADKDIALEGVQEENMELIMGVPLEISVEIGRTKKFVKDILDFTKGSLVVLDKIAGEQVDLFVNGQCIAKGDVVVVEDNFGIRITEIMKINLATLE